MKSRKFLKRIVWCMGIVLVIGICGLFIANYTVTKFMDVFAFESKGTPSDGLLEDPLSSKGIDGSSEQFAVITQDKENVQDKDQNKDKMQDKVQDKMQDKSMGAKNSNQPTGTVSDQQVNHVQESLTARDKANIISIMASSLDRSSSEKLWDLAKGGLTVAEKQEAKELLLATLSPDDYNKLSKMAKKYGISKGKTYDEAKREQNLQP